MLRVSHFFPHAPYLGSVTNDSIAANYWFLKYKWVQGACSLLGVRGQNTRESK